MSITDNHTPGGPATDDTGAAPRTIRLDQPGATDAALVGNKAAALGRLVAGGFQVPDAVVLSVGLAGLHEHGALDQWLAATVPGVLEAVGAPVAVRSSATWEDSSTSAHAGASVTELDVAGSDDVAAAVVRCVEGTLAAQREHATTGDVAVIIQRLVPARFAGVAFTADPLTGERGVVRIAATAGLGESLVQGEVTGSDLTVRGERIEGDLAGMAPEAVLELAEAARRIEDMARRPQDIEWALDDDGLHILQARDITVLPIEPTLPEGNNWQKDVAHYPEPLTPFGWSLLQYPSEVVHSVFDELGLLVRGLEELCVGGEAYSRVLPAFGDADDARKPPPAFVMGIAARIVPELRRRNATAKGAIESGLTRQWLDEWHSTDRAEMAALGDELSRVDLSGLSDEELDAHALRCADMLLRGFRIHFRLMMAMLHPLYRLHCLVAGELGWDDQQLARMLAGHSPATRAADDALDEVRTRVRSTGGAGAAMAGDPHRPVEALAAVDPRLAADLQDWMDEHAWSMVNYDAGVAVLAERPSTVTRLVLSEPAEVTFADADEVADQARAALPAPKRAGFDEVLAEARAVYPVRDDNTAVVGDRPLALLRRWMLEVSGRLVERGVLPSVNDGAYLGFDELRAALRGTGGDDLVERILQRRGEEAWTRAHPGPAFVGDQGDPPDISRLPAALRQVNEPVLWFIGHEFPPPVELPRDDSTLLAGVAASAGVAEGPVRVIRSHADMGTLLEGEVLVCQVTSPAWAPVFPLASAVVADGGGAFSHAAIAAREHGLPAVLGTATATRDLVDGQRVRVDGTRGLVLAAD